MLKEIRKVKSRGRANWIRQLQWRGRLPVHINENGYVCYDTEELKEYSKSSKRGRPLKIKGEKND